jgi:hypothetical protein
VVPTDLGIAKAIRDNFRRPGSLSFPVSAVFSYSADQRSLDAVYGILRTSELRFRLGPDGRLADTTVSVDTASPELDASLIAAVRLADSTDALAKAGVMDPRPGGQVIFHLVKSDTRLEPWVALTRVVFPRIFVDEPPEVVSMPKPRFPESFQQSGTPGLVDFLFVVTPEGRADPKSFRLIRANYREFIEPARAAILSGRFVPANIRGCRIPFFVRQRVTFTFGD